MEILGLWSHALAAGAFAALALWQLRRPGPAPARGALIGALLATALWAAAAAVDGSDAPVAHAMESIRNLGWVGYMAMLGGHGGGGDRRGGLNLLYLAVAGVALLALAMPGIAPFLEPSEGGGALAFAATVLRLIVAIGALVLVHNLYTAADPAARAMVRPQLIALAIVWTVDLNLYTIDYLTGRQVAATDLLRGLAALVAATLIAIGMRSDGRTRLRVSRTVAFQSLSMVAIGAYLVLMGAITSLIELWGGDETRLAQVGFVVLTSTLLLGLLPSDRMRGWLKVKVAKHLFQHRYDYRAEWIRFTETLGRPGEGAAPLDARVVKAVADITLSPGGILLVPDETGALGERARWRLDGPALPAPAIDRAAAAAIAASALILDLDAIRRGEDDGNGLPDWLIADGEFWAAVPCVHVDRLVALVLLARPAIDRTLDWEDFDLLRVVGRQAASTLAEAQGQEALSDARRFDEFNRRFAFIMHDIKNLVSQLTLLARNAERHADNPDFRADMVDTLQGSAGKMNDLLARLSQHNKARAEEPRPVALGPLIAAVAASKRALHPIVVDGAGDLAASADPSRLEQILGHLVQNAIDASRPGEPVTLRARRAGVDVAIEVIDSGQGMSAEFVRSQLFRPFASTKDGGFGVGAFEARTLAASMGGRIDVESREGEGSRFTLVVPQAGSVAGHPREAA